MYIVTSYIVYLAISLGVTFWVANTLGATAGCFL